MLPDTDSLTMLVIEDLVLSKLFEDIIFDELNDQYLRSLGNILSVRVGQPSVCKVGTIIGAQ